MDDQNTKMTTDYSLPTTDNTNNTKQTTDYSLPARNASHSEAGGPTTGSANTGNLPPLVDPMSIPAESQDIQAGEPAQPVMPLPSMPQTMPSTDYSLPTTAAETPAKETTDLPRRQAGYRPLTTENTKMTTDYSLPTTAREAPAPENAALQEQGPSIPSAPSVSMAEPTFAPSNGATAGEQTGGVVNG